MSLRLGTLRGIVGASLSLASLGLVWGCQSIAGIEERTLGPCGEFCDTVMANCTGENQVYDTRDKCMALCEILPPGDTVEPWRFALERLRCEGIDVDEWTPSATLWSKD